MLLFRSLVEASLAMPDVAHVLPYGSNSPTTAHASLTNTVVQLQRKSTAGSGFYWSKSVTFVSGYDPSAKCFCLLLL